MQQGKFVRNNTDKRLIILDEEFASGLMCTKREGNTLSMGLRTFWDSDEYEALTKNNFFKVKGAHINIVSHITIQELSYYLNGLQAYNALPVVFYGFVPDVPSLRHCLAVCLKLKFKDCKSVYGKLSQ